MTIEITEGFLMYWGGIAGIVLSAIGAAIYFKISASRAKKMLREIDKEDF